MPWNQNYDPLHFWPLSPFAAALPVLPLFFALLVLRKKVWISALCGFIVAVVLAASVLKMPVLGGLLAMIYASMIPSFVATPKIRPHSIRIKRWLNLIG
jgi:L-lactate permease